MKILQTLKYKLFDGKNTKTSVVSIPQSIATPQAKWPWECVAVQDMDKISPDAMRENNADFFLNALYQNGREMRLWNIVPDSVNLYDKFNWDGKLTPNALVLFPTDPLGKVLSHYYLYQNGTIYIHDLYDMGVDQAIPVAYLTPEQDAVFRHAIEELAKEHEIPLRPSPFNKRQLHEISAEEISRRPYRMIGYLQRDLERWQRNNPLQTPVRCDGCEQNCYMGQQKHYHTYADGSCEWEKYPTINHVFAKGCRGKCATKMQEYLNCIGEKQR